MDNIDVPGNYVQIGTANTAPNQSECASLTYCHAFVTFGRSIDDALSPPDGDALRSCRHSVPGISVFHIVGRASAGGPCALRGKNDRCDNGAGPGLQPVAEQSPPPSGLLQAVPRRGRKRSDASEKAQWRLRHALPHEVSDGLSLLRPPS
jgi:hypothetical protein